MKKQKLHIQTKTIPPTVMYVIEFWKQYCEKPYLLIYLYISLLYMIIY